MTPSNRTFCSSVQNDRLSYGIIHQRIARPIRRESSYVLSNSGRRGTVFHQNESRFCPGVSTLPLGSFTFWRPIWSAISPTSKPNWRMAWVPVRLDVVIGRATWLRLKRHRNRASWYVWGLRRKPWVQARGFGCNRDINYRFISNPTLEQPNSISRSRIIDQVWSRRFERPPAFDRCLLSHWVSEE